jgi:hypothetical protein
MEKKVVIYKNHDEQQQNDREAYLALSPEERLNQVEYLRLEAGKFLYEYPARLRRTVTITRRTPG